MAYKTQFDRWISFQFRSPVRARDQLEMRLARRLLDLGAECHLTEAQTKKLQLAGRGDIKRFMDRVNRIARVMEDPRSSVDDLRTARLEMNDLDSRASPRIFDDDSLLYKTLGSTLKPDQAAAREKALRERNAVRYRRAVVVAMLSMKANLGMNDDQCTRLAALLVQETRPPRKFGNATDVALVHFQASRIPEAKIRPIFDDAQWRMLSRWTAVYNRGEMGEDVLKRRGFVFDDPPAASVPDRVRPVSKKNETRDVKQNRRD